MESNGDRSTSASPTRERIVTATAELFRRQGYTGTGMKQIAAEAKAPFGSIYHFFPGGKDALADEVLRTAGAFFLALFHAFLDETGGDPPAGIEAYFAGAAETLRTTDYNDACPIATVALEVASTNEPLRRATADVFTSWIDGGVERLTEAGVPADRARELTIAILCGLEGAFVFSRALRSTEPLEVAGAQAAEAVRRALVAA